MNKTYGADDEYKLYRIELNGDEGKYVIEGEVQNRPYNASLEFKITTKNNKKEGSVMFYNGYQYYYCFSK